MTDLQLLSHVWKRRQTLSEVSIVMMKNKSMRVKSKMYVWVSMIIQFQIFVNYKLVLTSVLLKDWFTFELWFALQIPL